MLEAEALQPEIAPDGQQDHVPLDRRSIVELDDMGASGTLTGSRPLRPRARPQDHAVAEQCRGNRFRIADVVGWEDPRARLANRRRDAEPSKHLRQLDAGRPAAEDKQRAWQLAGERCLAVRPRLRLSKTVDRRDLGRGSCRDDDVVAFEGHGPVRAVHLDAAFSDDPSGATEASWRRQSPMP